MLFLYVMTALNLVFFSNDSMKLLHFGSKTPYRFIENDNVMEPKFEGCTPKKLWMISRHGTRNPSAKILENMTTKLPKIREDILLNSYLTLCERDALENWQIGLNKNEVSQLREEGKRELFLLAQRMQKRFPSLFPPRYSNRTYLFKFTSTERTNMSAHQFVKGLFGNEESKNVQYDDPDKNDFLLRFYKYCKKWQMFVNNNSKTFEPRRLFDKSFIVSSAIDRLNSDLTLKMPLTKVSLNKLNDSTYRSFTDDVDLMYTTCAFETAWNIKKSVWCYFLSLELVKILEFSNNLKNYYNHGYGYTINYEQACPLFADMINHLTRKDPAPTTAVYFTHSGTIMKFLAHLGLYKDYYPLNPTSYKRKTIKWNESVLDPFVSNIAVVKYTCNNEEKVAVFHQERIVKLPYCTELCSLDAIKKIYHKSINCEFEKMCKI